MVNIYRGRVVTMYYNTLLNNIENLRSEMESMASSKGSLLDPEVIKISQKLDELLNYYNRFTIDLDLSEVV